MFLQLQKRLSAHRMPLRRPSDFLRHRRSLSVVHCRHKRYTTSLKPLNEFDEN